MSVRTGDSPVGVATDPDGRVYVGNAGAGTVSVFDPTFNPVTGLPAPKTIRVGATPFVFGAFTTAGPPPPPPPAQFVLSLSTVGLGTITANPLPVSGTYTDGTVVTLTNNPSPNYQFTGWAGACTGSGSCVVTMDSAKSVTATFTLKQFVLSIGTVGSGTVSANPLPVGGTYGAGTVVTLTATPARTSSSRAGPAPVRAALHARWTRPERDRAFTAQFALTLTTVGNGTITANPAPVGGTYGAGTAVALTAVPGAGSQLSGWSGACSGTGACNVTMDAAKSVTATFTAVPPPPPAQFTLTLMTVGDGTITPQPGPVAPAVNGASVALAAPVRVTVQRRDHRDSHAHAGRRVQIQRLVGRLHGDRRLQCDDERGQECDRTFVATAPTTCDDKIVDLQKKVAAFKHPWWHDHQLKVALKMYAESLAELNRAKAKVGSSDKRYVHAKKEFDNGKAALCLGHYWRADHEFWETYVIAHEILKQQPALTAPVLS